MAIEQSELGWLTAKDKTLFDDAQEGRTSAFSRIPQNADGDCRLLPKRFIGNCYAGCRGLCDGPVFVVGQDDENKSGILQALINKIQEDGDFTKEIAFLSYRFLCANNLRGYRILPPLRCLG